MKRLRTCRVRVVAAGVVMALALAGQAGAQPGAGEQGAADPGYEVLWRRGGMSAPYRVSGFNHPSIGRGVLVAGYTGGAAAVGEAGTRWRFDDGSQLAEAAFGDLTGDGMPEVILGQYPRTVTVIDGSTGERLAALAMPATPDGLAVADATHDGRADLYVVTRSTTGADETANVVHLVDGQDLQVVWSRDLGVYEQIVMDADAGDVDGDGAADVVFGTRLEARVRAVSATGDVLWDTDLGGTVSNVALADGGRTVLATRTGGALASLDARSGSIRWSAPGFGGFARLSVADVSGDGIDDAVWTTYGTRGQSPTYQVLATDGASGLLLWARATASPPKGLDVGDLDGDASPDVAVSTQDPFGPLNQGTNFVHAYRGRDGAPLWTRPFTGEQATYLSDVHVTDIVADSAPEVVVAPYFDVLLGLRGADGAHTWRAPLDSSATQALVADLDGGGQEVIDAGDDFLVTARDAGTGTVRWSRDLGGEILALASVRSTGGRDVLAIALSQLVRLDGRTGEVVWTQRLQGWGAALAPLDVDGRPAVLVSARLPRATHGLGRLVSDMMAGSLALLDADTGTPRWQIQTPGAVTSIALADVSGDGVDDVVTASPLAQSGVMLYDGTRLASAPVPLWRADVGVGVRALAAERGRVLAVLPVTRTIVALDAAGAERWRREVDDQALRPVGFADVTHDGVTDALVATRRFASRVAAVDGATGTSVFDLDARVNFVTAAVLTALPGDDVQDLLFTSDGGTYGAGGVFAVDGASLASEPVVRWAHRAANARGLAAVDLPSGQGWLVHGLSTRPDALALLHPLPQAPAPTDP